MDMVAYADIPAGHAKMRLTIITPALQKITP